MWLFLFDFFCSCTKQKLVLVEFRNKEKTWSIWNKNLVNLLTILWSKGRKNCIYLAALEQNSGTLRSISKLHVHYYYYYNGLILPLYPELCCFKRDKLHVHCTMHAYLHMTMRNMRNFWCLLKNFQFKLFLRCIVHKMIMCI